MKMVTAIVQHTRFEEVRRALTKAGVEGMTISDVRGFGRQRGYKEVYRGAQYEVKFLPKVKFEVGVPDAKLEAVIKAIEEAARSGEVGDGKIFVTDMVQCVRIRTGERGEEAL